MLGVEAEFEQKIAMIEFELGMLACTMETENGCALGIEDVCMLETGDDHMKATEEIVYARAHMYGDVGGTESATTTMNVRDFGHAAAVAVAVANPTGSAKAQTATNGSVRVHVRVRARAHAYTRVHVHVRPFRAPHIPHDHTHDHTH